MQEAHLELNRAIWDKIGPSIRATALPRWGPLALPEDELDLLLGTFEAWIRGGGSATAAGAELFCHPNTVRYRLRRIEAGTGRVLANPGDVAELVTAVRAWRELPHS